VPLPGIASEHGPDPEARSRKERRLKRRDGRTAIFFMMGAQEVFLHTPASRSERNIAATGC